MKLLYTACLGLLLFLNACTVQQNALIQVKYTPKFSFNPDSTTILLINRVDINKAQIRNQKKLDVLKAAAYTSISYAGKLLSGLPHVDVINIVDSTNFTANTDSVDALAKRFRSNYVLALKSFSADVPLVDIDNATVYYNTNVDVQYILYEGNGKYYKKLNGTVADPNAELPYVNLVATLLFHPSVRNSKTELNQSAEHATLDALQDYLPATVPHNRPLYNDNYLQPANAEIQAGNYVDAERLLLPLTKSAVAEVAGKALYTLGIVYEAEGDLDGAYDLVQQSLNKYKAKYDYASGYLIELKTE